MSVDKKRYRIVQTIGNLYLLEKHDRWFNAFKPSGKFYWSYKGVTTGPFSSLHSALVDYRRYREYMKYNPNTTFLPLNTPESKQIAVKDTTKPQIMPENVIFVDFRKRMRIVTKL
jgi:hypothetical protein